MATKKRTSSKLEGNITLEFQEKDRELEQVRVNPEDIRKEKLKRGQPSCLEEEN
jgi:hypothetical protein